MNAKLPKNRRTETVKDKLARRHVAAFERLEATTQGLYGTADRTIMGVNPYSSVPIDDDFRPGTPEEWDLDVAPEDAAAFIERAHDLGSPLRGGFGEAPPSAGSSVVQQMGSSLNSRLLEVEAPSMAHTTGAFPRSTF